MKSWRIQTKRDWVIAFAFTALLLYGVLGRFTWRLNRILMYLTDPRLSDLNQPSGYGNVALTALIMGILTCIVLLLKKQPAKRAALALAVGCGIAALSVGAYFFHCSLLVHVPMEENPVSISVNKSGNGAGGSVSVGYDLADEELVKFIGLCSSLTELPRAEQKRARADYEKKQSENEGERILIWISYPRKYLHSYALLIYIDNGQIFAARDGGMDKIFFADNGLADAAERLLISHGRDE